MTAVYTIFRTVRIADCDLNLVATLSTGEFRSIVLNRLRKDKINIIHFLSHPSGRATQD